MDAGRLLAVLRGLPDAELRTERGGQRIHAAVHGRIVATLWLAEDAPWLLAFRPRPDLLPGLLDLRGTAAPAGLAGWVAITDPGLLDDLHLDHLLREGIRALPRR
ncbi:MAG: hypothetical protein RLZZ127_2392 [Planctomycetota bacterium]|jgi:hypothetical protein